ncbi:MAG TPA: aminodeoxychorismate synthase component I [Candidatus Dormibacteraeota bacterium]|nr:aminodeoxychorismate synthase component I [Candidatus Dormibacteraeota bacterium]
MRPLIEEVTTNCTPESLLHCLSGERGLVVLRSGLFTPAHARYSLVAVRPFLTFRSFASRCEVGTGLAPGLNHALRVTEHPSARIQFGNPWHLLDSLMARYELLEELDLPFPLGGCFGYWGYDLKNFVEPKLPRHAPNDLELPDCHVGFYDSVVIFDHLLQKVWVVSTGLSSDGSRSEERARDRLDWWLRLLGRPERSDSPQAQAGLQRAEGRISSNLSRADFVARVEAAQRYIRAGDIYQVNLAQRLSAPFRASGAELFASLTAVSPAPFSAFIDCGDFQLASSSPELFLRLSGSHVQTRPIKGTRPRSPDPDRDAQLSYELQTSPKEMAELLMITDLLRNDLGRICEYGSIHVPEMARLERYPHVQHLVSTVEGRLRQDVTHFSAFASCFPGGSISGAPKYRAMEIIDELEPVSRGPYTGALGYIGFNRESQLSITIRTAILKNKIAWYYAGAGIVADSDPAAEYEETLAKAQGFFQALCRGRGNESSNFPIPSPPRTADLPQPDGPA